MPLFPIDNMDKKQLGRAKEYVSAIGVGTWSIRDYASAREALKRAIELGLDQVDTAEMYDSGRAEELVGEVIREVGRERVFVTTKLLPRRFRSPEDAVKGAKSSLERMGIRFADLILIHWPDPQIPVEVQIRSLEAIAEAQLTRYLGVSNFSKRELEVAITSMKKHEITVNQVKYSAVDRAIEGDLLPYSIREGITIQAYSPLERGLLARDRLLEYIGRKYERSPVQVALNFLISRPRVVTIPKSEKPERIEEFAGALGWRLSERDIEVIERRL